MSPTYTYDNWEGGILKVIALKNVHSTFLCSRRVLKFNGTGVLYAGVGDDIIGVSAINKKHDPPASYNVVLGNMPHGSWEAVSGNIPAAAVETIQVGYYELDVGSTDACAISANQYVMVSPATEDAGTGKVAPWKPGFPCVGRAMNAGAKDGRVRVLVGEKPPPVVPTLVTASATIPAETKTYIFANPAAGVLTLTLTAPVSGVDDGRTVITFLNGKAKANIILAEDKINAGNDKVTFAAIGDYAIFTAYLTGWLVYTNGTIGDLA